MNNKLKSYFSFKLTYYTRNQFLWKIFPFFLIYTILFLWFYFQPQDFVLIFWWYLVTFGAIHFIFLWFIFLISFYLLCRIYENKNNFIKFFFYISISVRAFLSVLFPLLALFFFAGASDCEWRYGNDYNIDIDMFCTFVWSDLSNLVLVWYVSFLLPIIIALLLNESLEDKNE